MGAWGPKSFENDVATDWVGELAEWKDFGGVTGALDAVIADKADELDADVCEEGLAAAEIVAATLGSPGPAMPEDATAWIKDKPKPDAALVAKAIEALAAIREKSELRDLWEDSENFADWNASLDDLKKRLDSAKTGTGAA